MEIRERLLTGLAELLGNAGAGTWAPDGPAVADPETGIYIIRMPEEPVKIISIRTYDGEDDPKLSEMTQMVQVRTRGGKSPLEALALADEAYRALHGLERVFVCAAQPLHIVQIYRESEADVGPDTLGRYERTENYAVQLNSDVDRLE
jgi:hypothetical protein